MRKFSTVMAGAASAAVLLTATPASAAVNYDPGAGGFAGKGDVQTALGMNNDALQKAVKANSLTFSARTSLSQSLTQAMTQTGSQTATQTVQQEVSCTIDNKRNVFVRSGDREGIRTATRAGERDGTRSGTKVGRISHTVEYDPRVKNQITGFKLSAASTSITTWDTAGFGETVWEEWEYSGSGEFGETVWGVWESDTNGTPEVCFNSSNNPTNVLDETTVLGTTGDTEFVPGAPAEDLIAEGAVQTGATTVYVARSGGAPVAMPTNVPLV